MTGMVEQGIYVSVASVLLWAAATDLKERRIPNIQPILVTALFFLLGLLKWQTGSSIFEALVYPGLTGLLVFGFCIILYALGHMGGGDVKLISAMGLIAGPTLGPIFVVFVTIAGGLVALGTLAHAYMQPASTTIGQLKVPYGVAIMAGGLWVCLQKMTVSPV